MEAKTYSITDGPSILDLSISLFRRNRGDSVRFVLNSTDEQLCYITAAKSKIDDSTRRWELKGFLVDGLITQSFTASYSTSTRKGMFTVLKKKKR